MESIVPERSDWRRLPARQGIAARLEAGQTIRIINTSGRQVVDTWAFSPEDLDEWLSMEHSRVSLRRLVPQVGDTLLSNHRRPMLCLVEDTTAGHHDTLMAACDARRYELLGVVGHHDNCSDNLRSALRAMGVASSIVPCPLNLFMHIPWMPDGSLSFERPTSAPGQYVSLRAETDLIVALSACPQDLIPVNDMRPTDVHFVIS
jgi:uncharacterized protein